MILSVRDLDLEYLPEAGVPDYPSFVERFARESEAFKASLPPERFRSRAYATHPLAIVDAFTPAGPGPHPAVSFVHGGFRKRASRPARAFLARKWLDRDIAWVNVGYCLVVPRACRYMCRWADSSRAPSRSRA